MSVGAVKVKKVERKGGVLCVTLSSSEFVKMMQANQGVAPPAPPSIETEEQVKEST